MSHLTKNNDKLIARIRRMKGQMEAIERSLVAGKPCGDILNQVASVRGAINGLTIELLEEHVTEHISDPAKDTDKDRGQASGELIDILRTYLK